jgi:putative Holliday junction resolvase
VLALDFGLRRIGVATAVLVSGTASPLTTINAHNGEPDWHTLDALLTDWEPDLLVLGLPYNSDGTESDMTKRVRVFEQRLRERYQLPVRMMDERYTSAEAEAVLKAQRRAGIRKKKLKKADVDSMAAAIIAASWMRELDNNS